MHCNLRLSAVVAVVLQFNYEAYAKFDIGEPILTT